MLKTKLAANFILGICSIQYLKETPLENRIAPSPQNKKEKSNLCTVSALKKSVDLNSERIFDSFYNVLCSIDKDFINSKDKIMFWGLKKNLKLIDIIDLTKFIASNERYTSYKILPKNLFKKFAEFMLYFQNEEIGYKFWGFWIKKIEGLSLLVSFFSNSDLIFIPYHLIFFEKLIHDEELQKNCSILIKSVKYNEKDAEVVMEYLKILIDFKIFYISKESLKKSFKFILKKIPKDILLDHLYNILNGVAASNNCSEYQVSINEKKKSIQNIIDALLSNPDYTPQDYLNLQIIDYKKVDGVILPSDYISNQIFQAKQLFTIYEEEMEPGKLDFDIETKNTISNEKSKKNDKKPSFIGIQTIRIENFEKFLTKMPYWFINQIIIYILQYLKECIHITDDEIIHMFEKYLFSIHTTEILLYKDSFLSITTTDEIEIYFNKEEGQSEQLKSLLNKNYFQKTYYFRCLKSKIPINFNEQNDFEIEIGESFVLPKYNPELKPFYKKCGPSEIENGDGFVNPRCDSDLMSSFEKNDASKPNFDEIPPVSKKIPNSILSMDFIKSTSIKVPN